MCCPSQNCGSLVPPLPAQHQMGKVKIRRPCPYQAAPWRATIQHPLRVGFLMFAAFSCCLPRTCLPSQLAWCDIKKRLIKRLGDGPARVCGIVSALQIAAPMVPLQVRIGPGQCATCNVFPMITRRALRHHNAGMGAFHTRLLLQLRLVLCSNQRHSFFICKNHATSCNILALPSCSQCKPAARGATEAGPAFCTANKSCPTNRCTPCKHAAPTQTEPLA